MSEALQRAIDALAIEDVSIRAAHARMAEDYNPKFSSIVNPQIELKHEVIAFEIIEVGGEGASSEKYLRVFVDLGVRWLDVSDASNAVTSGNSEVDSPPEDELALIEAVMVADYSMTSNPGEEALEQFARENASFHIWPYWREYVSTQCHRMNLPRYMVPTRQFMHPADSPE